MAISKSTPAAIVPSLVPTEHYSVDCFPYVDDDRDIRDGVVAVALDAALQLIEDDEADPILLAQAAAVIRLARDRLQARDEKFTARFFTAEVAHGSV